MSGTPKAAWASVRACRKRLPNSSSWWTSRIPLPPPPALALIITGSPIARIASSPSASVWITALLPGISGMPARRTRSRALFLSPMSFIARAEGPMKPIRQLSQTSAKWMFSARKP